jgi:two-component system NtrC family sensor kinase
VHAVQVPPAYTYGRIAHGQHHDCAAAEPGLSCGGRIIIVDDITDRINMETQLAQSEKLSSIGLLAAGVAHEVNTPLAVISSYTQMLSKQLLGKQLGDADIPPTACSRSLEKITQQTFRASEIVNGLLNFSRMGSVDFARWM